MGVVRVPAPTGAIANLGAGSVMNALLWRKRLVFPCSRCALDSMSCVDVEELGLPASLYHDALEEHLLLEAFRDLHLAQLGTPAPAALSMAQRNDLLEYARSVLNEDHYLVLMQHAEILGRCQPSAVCLTPSATDASSVEPCSTADRFARMVLNEGCCSIWSAARLVLAHLEYRVEARLASGANQQEARLGAYGHRAFTGLVKATHRHRATCLLLNTLVREVRPCHTWTTLVITKNSVLSAHIDAQNARCPSLVLGMSHFRNGELWSASPDGSDFEEYAGKLVPGRLHQVSMNAILLPAATLLHSVRPSSAGDRVVLIAFSIGQHRSLPANARAELEQLGFSLPG